MRRSVLLILALAFVLIVLGIAQGDVRAVFANATLICFSCIGLQ